MEISRWANTQTKREVACPRCKVLLGLSCRTSKGRLAQEGPHVERLIAYRQLIGDAEFDKRHSVKVSANLTGGM